MRQREAMTRMRRLFDRRGFAEAFPASHRTQYIVGYYADTASQVDLGIGATWADAVAQCERHPQLAAIVARVRELNAEDDARHDGAIRPASLSALLSTVSHYYR